MKKQLFLLASLLLSFAVHGQTIFERYANNDDVTLVSISPKMFKMLAQMSISLDDPEAQEYLDMVTSINNFKVLVSSNQDISSEMLKWVNQEVSKNDLEQLMSIKDAEANVAFYVKEGSRENHVQQLLMYVTENLKSSNKSLQFNGRTIESVLLLLEGDIDLNKISKLTDQMDLPGGDQLKKAQKKNLK
ncbi:MAG: DUF4252 domain-containing protein [Flavobacteriaceae bacterium]